MNVSMNGLRQNLSSRVRVLRDLVDAVVEGEYFETSDLVEAMNDVIQSSNILNCVYSDCCEGFDDISNIEVAELETEDEWA